MYVYGIEFLLNTVFYLVMLLHCSGGSFSATFVDHIGDCYCGFTCGSIIIAATAHFMLLSEE